MISVSDAQQKLLGLVSVLGIEDVPLAQSTGRILAQSVQARRDQPPFSASAMDGYAVKSAEVERHAMFKVVGEAAAGHRYSAAVSAGQAVRIFTGAPLPQGTDFVVIQEDVTRKGDVITIANDPGAGTNIRPAAGDFSQGQPLLAPGRLSAAQIALLAAMNVPLVPVRRRPEIALISTGDELVMPGETPGPDQIVASNTFGLKALLQAEGARVRILPIARDNAASLRTAFDLAKGADLVVTIGGASVGDHDLVAPVAQELGMERAFYKVAMRPGKPLMAGGLMGMAMVGLPGNPVSAMVCGHIFLLPMVRRMLGISPETAMFHTARLLAPLAQNGPRAHYMRARVSKEGIETFANQDSSLLSVLAQSNALLLRPPHDAAQQIGEEVSYLPI